MEYQKTRGHRETRKRKLGRSVRWEYSSPRMPPKQIHEQRHSRCTSFQTPIRARETPDSGVDSVVSQSTNTSQWSSSNFSVSSDVPKRRSALQQPVSSGKAPGKRLWSAQNPPLTFRELIPKNYKSSRYVDDKDKENASGLTLSKSVPKKQPSTPAIPRRPLALKKF
uniref:Uncharacterized protein n=1 Tax=Panagrolaimus sp. JU765 TaxID=591449 RepID=A0AC34QEZ7_9BILA